MGKKETVVYSHDVGITLLMLEWGDDPLDATDYRVIYGAAIPLEHIDQAADAYRAILEGHDPVEEGWEYGDFESLDQAEADAIFIDKHPLGFDLVADTYIVDKDNPLGLYSHDPEGSTSATKAFIQALKNS